MDFVVVGFGLGALGVLLGVVMLGWLVPRAQRAAARTSSADDEARCQAIAAQYRGTGQALLCSGGAMLLATVAALAGSLDDRTGAFLVTTTATVAAIGRIIAGFLQLTRNPVPPRRRTRSAPAANPSMVTTPQPVDIPSFLADEYSWDEGPATPEGNLDGPHAETVPTSDVDGEAIDAEQMAPLTAMISTALSSAAANPGPLGDSPVAETTDSRSWEPADRAAGNGSVDRDFAETEETEAVGPVAPVSGVTKSSPIGPDEEDPSSGHS